MCIYISTQGACSKIKVGMILFIMDPMWMFMNEFHPQNNNYHGCHLQHKFIRRCWKYLISYIINS